MSTFQIISQMGVSEIFVLFSLLSTFLCLPDLLRPCQRGFVPTKGDGSFIFSVEGIPNIPNGFSYGHRVIHLDFFKVHSSLFVLFSPTICLTFLSNLLYFVFFQIPSSKEFKGYLLNTATKRGISTACLGFNKTFPWFVVGSLPVRLSEVFVHDHYQIIYYFLIYQFPAICKKRFLNWFRYIPFILENDIYWYTLKDTHPHLLLGCPCSKINS